jgi:hypothetical protein
MRAGKAPEIGSVSVFSSEAILTVCPRIFTVGFLIAASGSISHISCLFRVRQAMRKNYGFHAEFRH